MRSYSVCCYTWDIYDKSFTHGSKQWKSSRLRAPGYGKLPGNSVVWTYEENCLYVHSGCDMYTVNVTGYMLKT